MTDALLIFTFGPIQSFIAEARRSSDLFAGSKILSRLAFAAATALQTEAARLIYPANPNAEDMPNKLVACVPFEQAKYLAEQAQNALLEEWRQIAQSALDLLRQKHPQPDSVWNQIWQRQIEHFWEIFWAAHKIEAGYAEVHLETSRALAAVKRTRPFSASDELGLKDTLSGKRAALRTQEKDARAYWEHLSSQFNAAQIRPGGKELLDALGVVKRFGAIAGAQNFLSVSSVATKEYLAIAKQKAPQALMEYRHAIQQFLAGNLYRVRQDSAWPYDGDLFFRETLQPKRLEESYQIKEIDPALLASAQEKLSLLYQHIGAPSPYYALLELDGDWMGEQIASCTLEEHHSRFSQSLAVFSQQVNSIVAEHFGELIYNGGDDVLAFAPLNQAVSLAGALSESFAQVVKKPPAFTDSCSLSAGIAVVHHLYPLDAARQAAHQALMRAKEGAEKNALCVRILKRNGQSFDLRSPWQTISAKGRRGGRFDEVVQLFREVPGKGAPLSSRFAYDLLQSARILDKADEIFASELKRCLKRHRNQKYPDLIDIQACCDWLFDWARSLPDQSEGLARWMTFARFVAQGGDE